MKATLLGAFAAMTLVLSGATAQNTEEEQLFTRLSEKTLERILTNGKIKFERKETGSGPTKLVLYYLTFETGHKASLANYYGTTLSVISFGFRTRDNGDISFDRVNEWNKRAVHSKAIVDRQGSGVVSSELDLLAGTNQKIIKHWLKTYSASIVEFDKYTLTTQATIVGQDTPTVEIAIKKVVTFYHDRMKSGDPDEVEKTRDLFLNPEVPVLVLSPQDQPLDRKPLKALTHVGTMKFFVKKSGTVNTKLESVKVEVLSSSFAVATVAYSNDFVKGQNVFALKLQDGNWKIASLVTDISRAAVSSEPKQVPKTDTAPSAANIRVVVPEASAILFVDESKTNATGTTRQFHTPPLKPGSKRSYTIKVVWTQDGREMSQERIVYFTAGQTVVVDFTQPEAKADKSDSP